MRVEGVTPEEMMEALEDAVERRRRDKYSFQVKLSNVTFDFDEDAASALSLDPEMSRLEQAERYLREGVLVPTAFAESDGTRHEIVEWDPTPVANSGFMGCVTHSIVVTDRGTFEVGRYPAMTLETFDKVWQWFIHRRIDEPGSD